MKLFFFGFPIIGMIISFDNIQKIIKIIFAFIPQVNIYFVVRNFCELYYHSLYISWSSLWNVTDGQVSYIESIIIYIVGIVFYII